MAKAKRAAAKKASAKKVPAKKVPAKKAPAKKVAAKKEPATVTKVLGKTVSARGGTVKKATAKHVGGMPSDGQDPKGGLTAKGRKYFKEKDGLELRPGVKGPADTPKKMQRKGSFLRRHFANPPGPVVDAKGQPTRQALQAAAWGEPVPKNEGDERRLAEKGSDLLEKYHEAKEDGAEPGKARASSD